MIVRNIETLTPYDKNPRKNNKAVDKVLESLKLHGQVKPIVISEKGKPFENEVICCGHTTLEALKKFGAKEVKCVVKAFDSEKDFVDYNIRDNKTGEFAEWDETILSGLSCEFDIDLNEMGFEFEIEENENNEINDLSDSIEQKYEIAVECENEEEQEQKYNQLLELGFKCRLLTL